MSRKVQVKLSEDTEVKTQTSKFSLTHGPWLFCRSPPFLCSQAGGVGDLPGSPSQQNAVGKAWPLESGQHGFTSELRT